MRVGEVDALGGEFVDMRGIGTLGPIAGYVTIAEIVREDHDDIRLGRGGSGGLQEAGNGEEGQFHGWQ